MRLSSFDAASDGNAFREHEPADGLQPSLLLCSVPGSVMDSGPTGAGFPR